MKTPSGKQDESKQDPQDQELEELLRLGQNGIDEETRRFIEEVLKSIPHEPQPEIQVFTSYRGAGDAC